MLQWLANHASIFQGNSRPWEIFFNHFSLERKETNSFDIYYTFGKESEHKSKGANGHYTYIIFREDWEAKKRPQIGESLQLPPRPRAEGLRQPQRQGSDLCRNERGRWSGCLGKGGKKVMDRVPNSWLRSGSWATSTMWALTSQNTGSHVCSLPPAGVFSSRMEESLQLLHTFIRYTSKFLWTYF